MEWEGNNRSTFGLILKIAVGAVWIFINVVIFIIAPFFIVSILLDFGVPLNMPIVMWVFVLGGVIVGLAVMMAIFNYGTKRRAYSALGYTGALITLLIVLLTHLGGDSFGQIKATIQEITLYADINFFSNIIIGTVVFWGIIYAIELIAVVWKVHRDFKQAFYILKFGTAVCVILFLLTASFFMIVIYSATQIGGGIDEPPIYDYNNQGTILNLTDDTLDITYNFSVNNGGFLPIYDVGFRLDMIVNHTTSIIMFPGLKIGSAQKYIPELAAQTIYEGNLTIAMDSAYIASFLITSTTFRIYIYVDTTVTNLLPVAINITFYTSFN